MKKSKLEKNIQIKHLKEFFQSNSNYVFLFNYSSMNTQTLFQLRSIFYANKIIEFKIYKNTLLKFASKGTSFESYFSNIKGQTAFTISENILAISKACVEIFKSNADFERFLFLTNGVSLYNINDIKFFSKFSDISSARSVLLSTLNQTASLFLRLNLLRIENISKKE